MRFPLSAMVLSLVLTACSEPETVFDPAAMQVIDLTHAYGRDTIYWPSSPTSFELKKLAYGETPGGWFYASYSFCTPEHGGTHMDAPEHFFKGAQTVDRVPVEEMIAPVAVIDVSEKAAADPDYRLTVADIEAYEAAHGKIEPGMIVLMNNGWSARWPDRKAYLGDDRPGRTDSLHFPSFGAAAAVFLIKERDVAMIGVDTASIDYGPSKDFIVHRIAGEYNVPGLENLKDLDRVPPRGATLIALPIKIERGSGGPVRVVALVPKGT